MFGAVGMEGVCFAWEKGKDLGGMGGGMVRTDYRRLPKFAYEALTPQHGCI